MKRMINKGNINSSRRDSGLVSGWFISTIGLIFVSLILASLSVWMTINYLDQKEKVDTKAKTDTAAAVKIQADSDEAKFLVREKLPNKTFYGPDDYGRVSFQYPKTWSAYVDKDATTGGNFEAYLNPVSVPPVSSDQLFALRVTISEMDYDKTLSGFESIIKKGDLKSSSITANGVNGTKLVGSFSKNLRGAAVYFKIRDKTLIIQTDANTFIGDFDAIVQTIKFNQ